MCIYVIYNNYRSDNFARNCVTVLQIVKLSEKYQSSKNNRVSATKYRKIPKNLRRRVREREREREKEKKEGNEIKDESFQR